MRGLSLVRRMENQRKGCIKPPQAPWGPRFFGAAAVVLASMLSPGTGAARTWRVPEDAPTIQAAIDSSAAGDDVLVSSGAYREAGIQMKGGIWVHSEHGPNATIVDALWADRVFDCRNVQVAATIEGFEMRNGHAGGGEGYGGGVRCIRSLLTIRDCVITGCSAEARGGGVDAWQSDLQVENCRVVQCRADDGAGIWAEQTSIGIADCEVSWNEAMGADAGIWADGPEVTIVRSVIVYNLAWCGFTPGIGCASPALTIRDCLVAQNRSLEFGGGAVAIYSSAGVISSCTIVDNRGGMNQVWGLLIEDGSSVSVDRTIIAFQPDGGGIACGWGTNVSIRCCDIYGNEGGDQICGDDLGGNFSEDPLFCDAQNGDYTLDANSPCLPGNHPQGVNCGLIGARGQGCGTPPPTGACCFLDGSCVVAEQHDCEDQHGTYMGDGTTCDPNPCQPTPVKITTWGRIRAGFR